MKSLESHHEIRLFFQLSIHPSNNNQPQTSIQNEHKSITVHALHVLWSSSKFTINTCISLIENASIHMFPAAALPPAGVVPGCFVFTLLSCNAMHCAYIRTHTYQKAGQSTHLIGGEEVQGVLVCLLFVELRSGATVLRARGWSLINTYLPGWWVCH